MDLLRDASYLGKVEAAVGAAEAQTDAEIVVALAPASGSYRDADHRLAALVALLVLALVAWNPWIDPRKAWFVPDVLVAYALGLGVSARSALLRRALTSRRRRRAQVARAARLTFFEESVHATQERHGVLLYVSLFERIAEVVPDLGLEGKLEGARFHEISHALTAGGCTPEGLLAAIDGLGRALAEAFPKTPGDRDEISNKPRVVEG